MADPADVLILRALFPESEARFWGSRAVIDPRITPTEIARRTGLSRSTVQGRLNSWRQQGVLVNSEVWPNPKLFGAQLAFIETNLGPDVPIERMLESLSHVEGVISARDFLGESGRLVHVFVADDGPTGLERRTRLIQHISGSPNRLRAEPYWIPDPRCSLTPLDWRIVACYRAHPDDTLLRTSSRLGIGPRTLARRRDRLVDAHALWWFLSIDHSKMPVADFQVRLRDPARRFEVQASISAELGGWIPCAAGGFGQPSHGASDLIVGIVPAESPAMLDLVGRRISALAGVASVRWKIPCGHRSFPEWFERGIFATLTKNSQVSEPPSARTLAPGAGGPAGKTWPSPSVSFSAGPRGVPPTYPETVDRSLRFDQPEQLTSNYGRRR